MGLPDDVPLEVKKDRCNRLLALQRELSEEDNRRKIGTRTEVGGAGPSQSNPDRQQGRNDLEQVVLVDSGRDLAGRFYGVEIERTTDAALYGRLV